MKKGTKSSIGFDTFEWYPPKGKRVSNEWFMGRLRSEKINSPAEIKKRSGVDVRGFVDGGETILSTGSEALEQFLMMHRQYTREKCRRLFLMTTAVDASVLGIPKSKARQSELVQETAEEMCHRVGISLNSATGVGWACSSAAKATELALECQDELDDDEYDLLVAPEALSRNLDFSDPNTAFLFGDGVGIAVIKRNARLKILHAFADHVKLGDLIGMEKKRALSSDDSWEMRNCITMRGWPVFKHAAPLMLDALDTSLYITETSRDEITELIPHQANDRFIVALQDTWRSRYRSEPPPIDILLSETGNNGSGAWIRRMSELEKSGELQKKQGKIGAMFVGGGQGMRQDALSYGNILIDAA